MFAMSTPLPSPQSMVELPAYCVGLNPQQQQAVLTTEGPVLILAGAGTGKTRALTTRLAHILRQRLAWPSEILCVTFTNKAAREMQHRMAALLGTQDGQAEILPFLGTFHAVAARMLRRHAALVGLEANFTILDTDDQQRLMKQVLIESGVDEKRWPAKALAGLIDRFKNRGWTPTQVPSTETHDFADGKLVALYARYQARLIELNAADFGDLLLHMLTIFLAHHAVLAEYQRRFKYVLVDEYQDTNVAQYLWLRLLAQARRNIACVGDDDQSIYSWRGAEVANILRFEQDFPGATVIKLEQNYRSTPHILAAASGLIAHNGGRLGKVLWTDHPGGEKVQVVGVWDGPEEARHVGEALERLQRADVSLSDCAILVRAQFQTREFEDRFITIGLPYKIVGGFRFYERAEIRDALAYLRIVASPADSLAFERIINTPKRGLGDKAMQRLHAVARIQGKPLSTAAAAILETDEMTPAARRSLAAFMQDIARWRDQSATLTHPDLARVILEESGYLPMWQNDRSPEAAGRVDNLLELTRAMEDFDSLTAFLEHVALVMENESSDIAAKVTIMTLHGAKGLEFDHVFLVGWEEGVFPSQRALDEGGLASLEEERRLAYVGITRARSIATITSAANRRVYGQWTSSIPSRFVAELPEAHIERQDTLSGGPSLWRAALGASDPFGDVSRGTGRGPGWQRAAVLDHAPGTLGGRGRAAPVEARASAVSFAQPGRSDVSVGARVFHSKFGYGVVGMIDGNKLEIEFEKAGSKRVLDSFIEILA